MPRRTGSDHAGKSLLLMARFAKGKLFGLEILWLMETGSAFDTKRRVDGARVIPLSSLPNFLQLEITSGAGQHVRAGIVRLGQARPEEMPVQLSERRPFVAAAGPWETA